MRPCEFWQKGTSHYIILRYLDILVGNYVMTFRGNLVLPSVIYDQ